jgi:hypothetical protein
VNYFLLDAILESVFTLNLNFNLDIKKNWLTLMKHFISQTFGIFQKQLQSGLEISFNYINISGGQ